MQVNHQDVFSALANETRQRCLLLLLAHDELCVCELTHALDLSQPHVSRHLAMLREAGLVSDRRQGQWVHYRVSPELPVWVRRILEALRDGVAGRPPFSDDAAALAAMPNRPAAPRCA
jgi:ArsR family transcriptional regulator